ncbi:MAG: NlpC/P60 family protein [Salinivirgaceae bacterium]
MKNFYKKTGFLFLLLCTGIFGYAQIASYKTLSEELQVLQKQWVPDKRVAILTVELKDTLHVPIVLSGETNLPEAKKQIIQFLTDKKVTFIDSLRLLPDAVLGEKTWGLTTLSVSNLRCQPSDASELASQVVMGTPLKILESINKWYRVQTPEHYIGWMDTSGLKPYTAKELDSWKKSDRFVFNGITDIVYDRPRKKGEVVTDLVLGDLFEVVSKKKGFLQLKTPDGRTGYVRKRDCISFNDWTQSQPNIPSILSVARQMMGSPYLWGGTSTKATDCSGFVKMVYYSQGIILARDASQQARYGESIDFNNRTNLQPGDLLFFGTSVKRISHVGIYLGKGNFIHSSGRVHISSIDPNDPKYNAYRNHVAACRILNSLNTEGIVRVKDHPWYTVQP